MIEGKQSAQNDLLFLGQLILQINTTEKFKHFMNTEKMLKLFYQIFLVVFVGRNRTVGQFAIFLIFKCQCQWFNLIFFSREYHFRFRCSLGQGGTKAYFWHLQVKISNTLTLNRSVDPLLSASNLSLMQPK